MNKKIAISLCLLVLVGLLIYRFWSTSEHRQVADHGVENRYPDPQLTPGVIEPNATTEEICVKGYAGTVRHVTEKTHEEVFREYGLPYPEPRGTYEVDHLIPLELGGSNDIKNLWPEPSDPHPGFHQKDEVENYLHDEVCSGKVSLEEAQREIRNDWLTVYAKIPR